MPIRSRMVSSPLALVTSSSLILLPMLIGHATDVARDRYVPPSAQSRSRLPGGTWAAQGPARQAGPTVMVGRSRPG